MGTRADFYVGKGKDAEWIGSIALDGYPDGPPEMVLTMTTEDEFRNAVTALICSRDDGTVPEQGWPWPWKDSRTTDYAYCFVDDHVEVFCFGSAKTGEDENGAWTWADAESPFPDMTSIQKVTLGARSGTIIIIGGSIVE